MTAAVVFVGPSLAGRPVAPPPGIALRPPAAAGDLYRAARAGARVIGLVDGVFEDRPTVWHKEILWALSRGTRVLGAASLGALRAAECAPFGMEGVGAIYARARDGDLEDDHELALAYAPRELDYAPLSEPLVNVRATLDAARAAGVLTTAAAAAVGATAEALPYKALTWRRLAEALPGDARAAFEAWLPTGRIDLKRADALALLDAVAAAAAEPPPPPAAFELADTRYWQAATAAFESGAAVLPPEDAAVLDELRLDPVRYERALVCAYARRAAAGTEPETDPATLVEELREDLGLDTADAFRRWCAAARTTPSALAAALAAEERLLAALDAEAAGLAPAILDALRADGRFAALDTRAADKRARLAAAPEPVFREADLPGLLARLRARARVRLPGADDDPDAVARALGLADRRALHALLAREERYRAGGGETP